MVKGLPAMQESLVQSLGQEDPLEKEMATLSSILAWKIPWTEEPGGLQSMGSQSDTTEQLHFHTSTYLRSSSNKFKSRHCYINFINQNRETKRKSSPKVIDWKSAGPRQEPNCEKPESLFFAFCVSHTSDSCIPPSQACHVHEPLVLLCS